MERVAHEVRAGWWPAPALEMEWPLEMEAETCPLRAGLEPSGKPALGMRMFRYQSPSVPAQRRTLPPKHCRQKFCPSQLRLTPKKHASYIWKVKFCWKWCSRPLVNCEL